MKYSLTFLANYIPDKSYSISRAKYFLLGSFNIKKKQELILKKSKNKVTKSIDRSISRSRFLFKRNPHSISKAKAIQKHPLLDPKIEYCLGISCSISRF